MSARSQGADKERWKQEGEEKREKVEGTELVKMSVDSTTKGYEEGMREEGASKE